MIQQLNHTPAEILASYLVADSNSAFMAPGPNAVWPLYINTLPDQTIVGVPVNAACVFDSTGMSWRRLLASRRYINEYGIQFHSRSLDVSDGFKLLSALSRQLELIHNQAVMIGSDTYTIEAIKQTTSVIPMGQDDRRLNHHSLNLMMSLINA